MCLEEVIDSDTLLKILNKTHRKQDININRFNFRSMQRINEAAQWNEMVILQVMKAEKRPAALSFYDNRLCPRLEEGTFSCHRLIQQTNNLINTSIADYHLPNKSLLLLVSYFKSINGREKMEFNNMPRNT